MYFEVLEAGLEPARPQWSQDFKSGVSTNSTTRAAWSGKRDSNPRPRPWQGRALPTELFPHLDIVAPESGCKYKTFFLSAEILPEKIREKQAEDVPMAG